MNKQSVLAAVTVAVAGSTYEVSIGTGLLSQINRFAKLSTHARRAAVVSSGVPCELYADVVAHSLAEGGLETEIIELPDGEVNKTISTLERCCRALARIPLGRDDVVVAVGGGMIGDLAGFAAAIWNRGISVIQVPTTLLAQVDAAIGGKTGLDLHEGKNLIGAFHQPSSVIIDIATLRTLPERQRRAGLGEVAKYGFIADPEILELLELYPAEAVACNTELIEELVRRSVVIKARVVAGDEREAGERAFLNYGHTVGHAIEAIGEYEDFLHGEAIALGMVFAARLGERLGLSESGLAARTVSVLDGLGLPTSGVKLDLDRVWELMRRDKKARQGVRFVVCSRPGQAQLIDQPDPDLVNDVLMSLATPETARITEP